VFEPDTAPEPEPVSDVAVEAEAAVEAPKKKVIKKKVVA
jgi:hypothetical protein